MLFQNRLQAVFFYVNTTGYFFTAIGHPVLPRDVCLDNRVCRSAKASAIFLQTIFEVQKITTLTSVLKEIVYGPCIYNIVHIFALHIYKA